MVNFKFDYSWDDLINDLKKGYVTPETKDYIKEIVKIHEPFSGYDYKYVENQLDEFIKEFSLDGGNTISNIVRGWKGVSYLEIISDVSEKLNIKSSELAECKSIMDVDQLLVMSALKKYVDKLSEQDKQKFFKDTKLDEQIFSDIFGNIRRFAVGCVNMGLRATLEIAGPRAVGHVIKVAVLQFAGIQGAKQAGRMFVAAIPFINVILGAWLVADIAGPAYRKTIKSCLLLALLRLMMSMPELKDLDDECD